jgi:hypothetical protein
MTINLLLGGAAILLGSVLVAVSQGSKADAASQSALDQRS